METDDTRRRHSAATAVLLLVLVFAAAVIVPQLAGANPGPGPFNPGDCATNPTSSMHNYTLDDGVARGNFGVPVETEDPVEALRLLREYVNCSPEGAASTVAHLNRTLPFIGIAGAQAKADEYRANRAAWQQAVQEFETLVAQCNAPFTRYSSGVTYSTLGLHKGDIPKFFGAVVGHPTLDLVFNCGGFEIAFVQTCHFQPKMSVGAVPVTGHMSWPTRSGGGTPPGVRPPNTPVTQHPTPTTTPTTRPTTTTTRPTTTTTWRPTTTTTWRPTTTTTTCPDTVCYNEDPSDVDGSGSNGGGTPSDVDTSTPTATVAQPYDPPPGPSGTVPQPGQNNGTIPSGDDSGVGG